MKYPDKKWEIYLKEMLGDEIAANCKIEAEATANNFYATVRILNFNKNNDIINKLKNDNFIENCYLASGHKSTQIFIKEINET